jgi:hypothetical protein
MKRSKRVRNPSAQVATEQKARDARRRALEVLSLMRNRKLSLRKAAKEALTTPRTVVKYAKSALQRSATGRYRAKPHDRLTRHLRFLDEEGQIIVKVQSSRTASTVAEYWAGVDHYLKSGDAQRLERFQGKSLRAGKAQLPFITDLSILDRIASAGEVTFEDLYPPTA